MKLVSVSQMRAIEKEADSRGISYSRMMENAGSGLAELVHSLGEENGWEDVTGLVGPGNNGGDTLVALTWLAEAGWHTHALLVNRSSREDELVNRFSGAGGEILQTKSIQDDLELRSALESSDVLLDGLLGTGTKLPLRMEIGGILKSIKQILPALDAPPFIVAVDCPSGVDCDTGEAAPETLPADLTITMAAVKQGLLKLPGYELAGDLEVVDIGLSAGMPLLAEIKTEVADHELVSTLIPERRLDSHKGTFGTAFIVAGSLNYTGAAFLAGQAAYRIGAGLVTLAVPGPLHGALAGHLPEATWILLPHENGFISEAAGDVVLKGLDRATAVLIGPGLGNHFSTEKFVETLVRSLMIPSVIDADGLRHLSQIENWHRILVEPAILTPHPGEMSAMTGLSIGEIQSDRIGVATRFAQTWGHVLVLKGAFTVIASPQGKTTIIPVATPALAKAGSGDVLAGLIVGLRAQGVDAYAAAIAGAFIHAQAGLLAAEIHGTATSVIATDVLGAVREILGHLK